MDPILSTGIIRNIPIVHLTDTVVYPHGVQPLLIGTDRSIQALNYAQKFDKDKQVVLVAKKDPTLEDPGDGDLFEFGTVSTILQLIKLPDGTVKFLAEGRYRAKIHRVDSSGDFIIADVVKIEEQELSQTESEALIRSIISAFNQYVQLSKKVPPEVMTSLNNIDQPSRLVDTIAQQMTLKLEEKQKILELVDLPVQG